jgi:hypothetical protein
MTRQSLEREYQRGEGHGRRDPVQACVLLASFRYCDEAGEWLPEKLICLQNEEIPIERHQFSPARP